jgi:hypothetical protein
LKDCANPPNGEPFTKDEIDQAAYEIAKAVHDCAALDSFDGGSFFSDRLRTALNAPLAYCGLAWKVMGLMTKPDRKKMKPIAEAFQRGPDYFTAATMIHELREYVRDGVPLADAVSWIGGRFPRIADGAAGLEFFSNTLPAVLHDMQTKSERYGRGVKGWIMRAWIPLALWHDFNNPQRVHDVLERARDIYPPLQDMKLEYEEHFLPAWNKIKPKRTREV